MNDTHAMSAGGSSRTPGDITAPSSKVLRVEMREPSQHFREAVDRNLKIGRAAAANKKK
jgi:hypothetical protein